MNRAQATRRRIQGSVSASGGTQRADASGDRGGSFLACVEDLVAGCAPGDLLAVIGAGSRTACSRPDPVIVAVRLRSEAR